MPPPKLLTPQLMQRAMRRLPQVMRLPLPPTQPPMQWLKLRTQPLMLRLKPQMRLPTRQMPLLKRPLTQLTPPPQRLMLLPYLGWRGVATGLNWRIMRDNPGAGAA